LGIIMAQAVPAVQSRPRSKDTRNGRATLFKKTENVEIVKLAPAE